LKTVLTTANTHQSYDAVAELSALLLVSIRPFGRHEDSQRQKIRESLKQALAHFTPERWILCLAADMDAASECAEAMAISPRTVKRDWAMAKASMKP